MIHVEGYGNWYTRRESLDPFVCVHVEKKREVGGMELLYAVATRLEFAWVYRMVV